LVGAKKGNKVNLEQCIIIARPIEEVFAYRSALQNSLDWQPDVLASDLATPGVTGLGARGTECRRGPNGVTEEWELEITEFEQDRVLGIVSRFGSVRVYERHIFAADEGNTRYTVYLEVDGSWLPAAIVRKKTVERLVHLKWQLEAPGPRPHRGSHGLRAALSAQARAGSIGR
jgi:hypothetical protein